MTKRRAQQTARKGRGSTSKYVIYSKPVKGPVKPVISRKRHGKPVEEPEVSDAGLFSKWVSALSFIVFWSAVIYLFFKIFNT